METTQTFSIPCIPQILNINPYHTAFKNPKHMYYSTSYGNLKVYNLEKNHKIWSIIGYHGNQLTMATSILHGLERTQRVLSYEVTQDEIRSLFILGQ